MASTRRLLPGLLAGGLLLPPLAACSGTSDTGSSAATDTAVSTSLPGGGTASASGSAGISGSAGASGSAGKASCSGTSCSVTLNLHQSSVQVLGQTITLGSVQGGKASLSVAGRQVSCRQGESTSAGPLKLTCSSVSNNSVTLTASLG